MSLPPWEKLAGSLRLPSPVEPLDDERLRRNGVEVLLKRDDLIHPEISGNKWRKLKYNLIEAARQNHKTLLTFGGAYSNHIRAVASAGRYCGFSTVGIIRGEENLPLNPSLAYAVSKGMRLSYMDRLTYRQKSEAGVIAALAEAFGSFYLLPEGGSNELAVRGCSEIPAEIKEAYDVICCPCGTGGTLAGISACLKDGQRAIGFSVLKGGQFLAAEVAELQRRTFGSCSGNWEIEYDFHFGGFARRTADLDGFIADFLAKHRVALEWVYVAKMLYGVFSLVERGAFDPGSRLVVVITGTPGAE
ncbi:MAG TPA: pyridoxal-phosphate dependent enzyme [Streptosporangiaceae bacterium]|jgi:1-aminocyclopropane-1-carboxylate deaminase